MHRLLLFCVFLATMYTNSESMHIVICERLIFGFFCLPGPEADPVTVKPLLDFSNWEIPKIMMQAGKRFRELEEQEQDQELEKRGMRPKDGRLRILRMPEDSWSN